MSDAITPEVDRLYYRKGKAGQALVVRIESVDEWVEYQIVHGPKRLLTAGTGRCKLRNFTGWTPTEERADYSDLDGCRIFRTFLVLDTAGEPILRCSEKRARFYLRKGYAREVSEGVLQFTDDQTERQLRVAHGDDFSEFFLAVKNDRCVSCGAAGNLTRHHVIPQRHKKKVPAAGRRSLSNVLFLCADCHRRYEEAPEPNPEYTGDWREYAHRWKQHFLDTLSPQYMPVGWDITWTRQNDPEDRDGQAGDRRGDRPGE